MKTKKNNQQQQQEPPEPLHMKLAVVGDGAVGKSSLTIQFIRSVFLKGYDPTIEDSYTKHVKIDGSIYYLDIVDTAGQEEYKSLRDHYMRVSEGFLLVYSVTDKKSFAQLGEFVKQITRAKEDNEYIPMVLVANKCDLKSKRKVRREDGLTLAKLLNIPYFETSALGRENVDEVFSQLVRDIKRGCSAESGPIDNTCDYEQQPPQHSQHSDHTSKQLKRYSMKTKRKFKNVIGDVKGIVTAVGKCKYFLAPKVMPCNRKTSMTDLQQQ